MTLSRQDGLIEALPIAARGHEYVLQADALGLYEQGGVAATIVDRIADDATAHGWRCEGDDSEIIADEWSRLNLQPVLADAGRLARLTGAAAVLVLCEDNSSLREPLNEARIGSILGLVAIAGDRLSPEPELYGDASRPGYGTPMRYRVQPEHGGDSYVVHETRLLRVPGEPMPRRRVGFGGVPWSGRPVLDGAVAVDIRRYRDALGWIPVLLERKQQPVYAMSGLAETLALGVEGEQLVQKRLNVTDTVRGVLNTVAVDADDTYTITDLSLSGVSDGLHELKVSLCASSGHGMPILFGEQPKGLNATGEGANEAHYSKVGQFQNRTLRPAVERLTYLIWRQAALQARADTREPARWQIEFNPLWTETDGQRSIRLKAEADTRKANADTLVAVAGIGSATPEELRGAVQVLMPELGLDGEMPLIDDPGDLDDVVA